MIKKDKLQSIISKYYLDVNENVMWVVKDNTLCVRFMNSAKDVIGEIKLKDFLV